MSPPDVRLPFSRARPAPRCCTSCDWLLAQRPRPQEPDTVGIQSTQDRQELEGAGRNEQALSLLLPHRRLLRPARRVYQRHTGAARLVAVGWKLRSKVRRPWRAGKRPCPRRDSAGCRSSGAARSSTSSRREHRQQERRLPQGRAVLRASDVVRDVVHARLAAILRGQQERPEQNRQDYDGTNEDSCRSRTHGPLTPPAHRRFRGGRAS